MWDGASPPGLGAPYLGTLSGRGMQKVLLGHSMAPGPVLLGRGPLTARPRPLWDPWAVSGRVVFINPGLHGKCSHAGSSLEGSATSRGTVWMCRCRSPPEMPQGCMSAEVVEEARSRCRVLPRRDLQEVGTRAQRTPLLHPCPTQGSRRSPTAQPGKLFKDQFPAVWAHQDHDFLHPGFMA